MAPDPPDIVDIVLIDGGSNLIATIKEIRNLTGVGLAEAKDLAQQTPAVIAGGVERTRAGLALAELEKAGAAVELRSSTGKTVSSVSGGESASLELLVKRGALTETERVDAKAVLEDQPSDEFRSMVRMLTELHHLFEQGILSEAEFNTKKWEVLSRK